MIISIDGLLLKKRHPSKCNTHWRKQKFPYFITDIYQKSQQISNLLIKYKYSYYQQENHKDAYYSYYYSTLFSKFQLRQKERKF